MRRSTLSVLVAGLMVASVVVGVGGVGSALAAPDGMVSVSDSQITSDLPPNTPMGDVEQRLKDEGVLASDHAGSLDVTVTNPGRAKKYTDGAVYGGGPVAIVLSDDVHHEGREVAIPRVVLEDVLGYTPEAVYGTHEDGTPWVRETTVEDGYIVFEVPHFSTNTVTFSGEISLTGNPASDGSSYTYDINDLDAVNNFTIDTVGVVATEWDNESALGVGLSSSQSISVAGNLNPLAGDGGDPKLTVTANPTDLDYNPVHQEGDGVVDSGQYLGGDYGDDTTISSEVQINPNNDGELSEITVNKSYASGDYNPQIDIYLVQEGADAVYGEGTKVHSAWNPVWSGGKETVALDSPQMVSAGTTYTLEFVTTNTDNDGTAERISLDTDTSASSTWVTSDGNTVNEYGDVQIVDTRSVNNLSVSSDDGASASFGDIASGNSVTKRIGVTTSSTSLSWSGDGGASIDYTLKMKERTETPPFGLNVNGQWTNDTTGLADGETGSLSTDTAWIQEGTNTVDVSVGDGSLSADAPTPKVEFTYVHEAESQQTVDYEATTWTSQYNVSKTFASDQTGAQLEVPFESNIVSIESIEQRTNGGSWSSVADADYSLDGTDLTVDLGSVSTGDEVEVRTEGRIVKVINGSITVDDPTVRGDDLSTGFTVDSVGTDMHLDVSGTGVDELHYLASQSWSGTPYAEINSGGSQLVHLKGANAGSTGRMETAPLRIEPSSGGLEALVEDVDTLRFELRKGSTSGSDDVSITYLNALSGEDYELYNEDKNAVEVTATANSPVTFSTGILATYSIREASESSATVAVGGSGGGSGALPVFALFAGVGVSMTLVVFAGRKLGASGRAQNAILLAVGSVLGLIGVEAVTARSIVGDLVFALESLLTSFGSALAASGAGTIVVGTLLFLGIWLVDSRVWDLPRWLVIILGGAVGMWVLEDVSGGALSSGLSEISALVWLVALGGGVLIVYRALGNNNGPTIEIAGRMKK